MSYFYISVEADARRKLPARECVIQRETEDEALAWAWDKYAEYKELYCAPIDYEKAKKRGLIK